MSPYLALTTLSLRPFYCCSEGCDPCCGRRAPAEPDVSTPCPILEPLTFPSFPSPVVSPIIVPFSEFSLLPGRGALGFCPSPFRLGMTPCLACHPRIWPSVPSVWTSPLLRTPSYSCVMKRSLVLLLTSFFLPLVLSSRHRWPILCSASRGRSPTLMSSSHRRSLMRNPFLPRRSRRLPFSGCLRHLSFLCLRGR